MKRTRTWICAAIAVLVVAACDGDGPGEPAQPELDEQAVLSILGGAGLPTGNGVRPCPAGGEIEASSESRADVVGDTATVTFEAMYELRGCTHIVDGDPMISDGTMEYDGMQRFLRTGEQSSEIIESVVHQGGRIRIRYRDYDRTCDMDLTHTLDAGRDVIRITGTLCDKPVNVEGPRPRVTRG